MGIDCHQRPVEQLRNGSFRGGALRANRKPSLRGQKRHQLLKERPVATDSRQVNLAQHTPEQRDQCVLDATRDDVARALHVQKLGEIPQQRFARQGLCANAAQCREKGSLIPA